MSGKQKLIHYGIAIFTALLIALLLTGIIIYRKGFMTEMVMRIVPFSNDVTLLHQIPPDQLGQHQVTLRKQVTALKKILLTYLPRKPYLIINTTNNTFTLMNATGDPIRIGMCSTGSYTILTRGDDQKWIFETPRGILRVKSKQADPVWVKPDWAFIEEGLPVPSPRHPSRYDHATLGDYKLELGNGYLIHGTLYKRFLGMAVTHGCIRLGDDDLKAVYQQLSRNSCVFIY